jgi:triacylglycerol lipase
MSDQARSPARLQRSRAHVAALIWIMRVSRIAVATVTVAVAISSFLLAQSAGATEPDKRAVVLVSGTAATTPFTTPTQACTTGFSAGHTWTYVRAALTARGYQVFTAPASVGGAQVTETNSRSVGPFANCPAQLPASMTINAIGTVDQSGANLARFVTYLNTTFGITSVDIVGHSLGGLIGRSGIRELRLNHAPVTIRSYSTLGSPWDGTQVANVQDPKNPLAGCDGGKVCEGFLMAIAEVPGIEMLIANLSPKNEPVWNMSQVGVLDDIPVTLIGGSYFTNPKGNKKRWPNDGVIETSSALARQTPDSVIPHRRCVSFPLTHSLFVSTAITAPKATALTWNPKVVAALDTAFAGADSAMSGPNRVGCPKAQ